MEKPLYLKAIDVAEHSLDRMLCARRLMKDDDLIGFDDYVKEYAERTIEQLDEMNDEEFILHMFKEGMLDVD